MSNQVGAPEKEHIHFVTGRLAEHVVRRIVGEVANEVGFGYSIDVLPITVAALMTPKWLLRHISLPPKVDRIIVPGYLHSGTEAIAAQLGVRVESGPRDIRELPAFFGKKRAIDADYGAYSIEILAEINHAATYSSEQLLQTAQRLVKDGANIIDLGCTPGSQWRRVGDAVRMLRQHDIRVSIDTFDIEEAAWASAAGAELVLSVNTANRAAAIDWGCEVVAIPDTPEDEKSFVETAEFLSAHGVPCRLDPILEPIGCGFARSLQRYVDCRRRFPDRPMMMGIGNLTELTDADSAAINVLLLAICEELRIQSVLTTQVIHWASTSVRECDLARRLVHHAIRHRIPPKHIEPRLVLLRDDKPFRIQAEFLDDLSQSIKDRNFRIFAEEGQFHLVSAQLHLVDSDPFSLMQQLLDQPAGQKVDSAHAFYLGFELCKAWTAETLGKRYEQDEPLRWGYLTRAEKHHRVGQPKSTEQDRG